MINPKAHKGDIKTPEQSDPMKALRTKLKACDSEIQNFVAALEAEILNMLKKNAKLQAENVKLNGWITILEEDTNKRCVHETPPYECLTKKEKDLQEKLRVLKEELNENKPKIR